MKVKQEPGFKPITIVLETAEEAAQFREIMDEISADKLSDEAWNLSVDLSDMFTDGTLKI